jgi:carboxyl-terminal processing protease
MKLVFESAGGGAPAPVELRSTIKALDRPLFQYAYQIADDRAGNGDGRIQKGEGVTMYLTVKNVGKGRSYETQANIANLSGEGLLLHAGRFDISNMQPGDTRRVVFSFDVQQQLADKEATLSLSVGDRDLREFAAEKVKIPIDAAVAVDKVSGVKKAGEGATLRPTADANARAFGKLGTGALLNAIGKSGDFWKVDLGQGRFGFVAAKELSDASGTAGAPAFDDIYAHAPPTLDVSTSEMATRSDKVKISGTASDSEKLADIYVFVGSRKLYYRSNRDGADPRKASFDFDAPLRPGVNLITVVARENPDTVTRRMIIVRKDGADGTILKTPRSDDPIDDFAGGDASDE